MRPKLIIIIVVGYLMCCALFLLCGCLQPLPNDTQHLTSPVIFSTEWLDSMIEIAQAFSLANAASAVVNPYYIPVGVGLAGLTAMLEALRRKEKSGRKHAEHELNNGSNNK